MVMVMFIHFFIQVASLKNGRFHTQISFVLLKRDFVCHFRIFWLFKLMSLKKNCVRFTIIYTLLFIPGMKLVESGFCSFKILMVFYSRFNSNLIFFGCLLVT